MSEKSEFVLTVGQAQEIEFALRRNGFDTALVKVMTIGNNLSLFRKVLLYQATVTDVEHLIDLDADPFVPSGWSVPKGCHQKGGQFKWDPAKVALYLSKEQQDGKVLEGNKLREELKGKSPYNANLLDYLLKNPYLIPEEWKGKYVSFFGTEYRNSDDNLYVRCLCWRGGGCYGLDFWLGLGWDGFSPAAVPAG